MATLTFAVGYDGSADADAALRWALALAQQAHADVVVVHAVGLIEHATASSRSKALESRVLRLVNLLGFDTRRVRWHPEDGDPYSVLMRASADPVRADMIVVGSRGHGAHSETLLGSTSHDLAETCPAPLLIVPTVRPGKASGK